MEIACLICGGRCGAKWKKMIMDTRDSGEAHWLGGCNLPEEERKQVMKDRMEAYKREHAEKKAAVEEAEQEAAPKKKKRFFGLFG